LEGEKTKAELSKSRPNIAAIETFFIAVWQNVDVAKQLSGQRSGRWPDSKKSVDVGQQELRKVKQGFLKLPGFSLSRKMIYS
jgi:hypothetical protein